MQHINFYRNKVAINVLAKDIANARVPVSVYPDRKAHVMTQEDRYQENPAPYLDGLRIF